jgi:hypothetical protein
MNKQLAFILANTILGIHFLYGAFLLVGWSFHDVKVLYLSSLLLWISSWIFLGYCPLTKWEFKIRQTYDPAINLETEIIQHYVNKFFGVLVPARVIFSTGLALFTVLFFLGLKN